MPAQPNHGAFVIRVARGKSPTIMSNVGDRPIAQKTTQILRPRATAWNPYRRDHVVGVGWVGRVRGAPHMEKVWLLCLLMAIIGLLAEMAPAAQPRQQRRVPASSPPISA